MRIKKISSINIPPVMKFEVDDLSDLVIVAGPNGVGKTRLISAMLNYFKTFKQTDTSFEITATCAEEIASWGSGFLSTSTHGDDQKLRQTLSQNQKRKSLKSSIIYYESDRSIQKIEPLTFQWEFADPWEERIGKDVSFNPLKSRWQDTIHAIFKKIQSQKSAIASRAIQLKAEGFSSMNLEFSDPLEPFKVAFEQLLGPKKLVGADVQKQKLIYSDCGREDDVKSLSSGEREVLNIIFDFILREPSDCIVFFDEPELHLHPELLHKLITTLRSIGKNNQFILISHSPSIIASSLEDSVVFLTPAKSDGSNQAVIVKPDDTTSSALHKLGQSIGVVALGRKIALIEGSETSLDKQTYGQILENRFSNIVLQPVGGKYQLISFDAILDNILNRTIWGVDFYMLADKDAAPIGVSSEDIVSKSSGRFRVLERYHLENYFLDEVVLSACFRDQEPANSWLRNENEINAKLVDIAKSYLSYATSLIVAKHIRLSVGNVNLMPKACTDKSADELCDLFLSMQSDERARVMYQMNDSCTENLIRITYARLEASLLDGTWKSQIPGKPILAKFASVANIPLGRLKALYILNNNKEDIGVFSEIESIFQSWSLE